MDRTTAIEVLTDVAGATVADVYDADPTIPEAIGTLLPGFEYPAISHMKIRDLIRRAAPGR